MPLIDHDLELIDRYLDGDLAEAEAVGFEARLTRDGALSDELSRARELRRLRAETFASLEPGEVENQQLQWYIRGALHQAASGATGIPADALPLRERARALLGGLSKVAAVLLVGFVVGYGYRTTDRAPTNPGVVSIPPIDHGLAAGSAGGLDPRGAEIRPVGQIPADPVAAGDGYVVALRDQFGNVVTTRKFRTLQEARDFVADVERWQQRYRQVQKNGVRFIGDDF